MFHPPSPKDVATTGVASGATTAPSFTTFAARPPWWGADLQTLRNRLVPGRADLAPFAGRRVRLALTDGSGDFLIGTQNQPREAKPGPLVVLIHGVAGCQDSLYILASAAFHLARGSRVLRLNLRGAGPSRATCRLQYHAGRSEDLRDALTALGADLADGLFLVGFSLGGNMLVKFLAEFRGLFPIVGAATVSAPLDLAGTARRMCHPRNWLYHRWLLGHMKAEALGPGAEVSTAERRAIEAARTIYAFDRDFSGPRNGYAGADDYYRENSARRFIGGVATPTLLIHARNDPWIPVAPYLEIDWARLANYTVLLPAGGGHVGFHGVGSPIPWHDRCIGMFLDRLVGDARGLEA